MNENVSKMRVFCKKHRKEIAIASIGLAATVAAIVMTKKITGHNSKKNPIVVDMVKSYTTNFGAEIEEYPDTNGARAFAAHYLTVEDLAKFGDELVKIGAKPEARIWSMVEMSSEDFE